MKDIDSASQQPQTAQAEPSLDLQNSSIDPDLLEERKRLSAAMSSYYLLYR